MAPSALLPGFRFHPTDVELVLYYLKRKVMGRPFRVTAISEIDIYKYAPWDLPEKSFLKSKDLEWYFFCPRDRKYSNSSRPNRSTDIGYWKATGKDRTIFHRSRTVGMRKTLIFHIGKAPRGDRTDWVMYEYRLDDKTLVNTKFSQNTYVLCKIFQKSGPGPKNGEQYGAPFDEEEWEHDEPFEDAICLPSVLSHPEPPRVVVLEPVSYQPEVDGDDDDGDDDDGRSLMAYLAGILNSSPLHWEAEGETSVSLAVHKNGNGGMYNELEEHFGQDGVGLVNSGCVSQDRVNDNVLQPLMSELSNEHYMELNDLHFLGENSTFVSYNTVNEYAVQPLMSELGNELYMELNDHQFIEENSHCEMIMPNYLFSFDSFCWNTNLQNIDPACNINISGSTLLSNCLLQPGTSSDLSRLIQEVDESGSGSNQSDLNGCQSEDL